MSDTGSRPVLDLIDPPIGGWERLRSRRDSEDAQRAPWFAFAAGLVVASVGVVIGARLTGPSLTLPADAARLQGKSIADEPPRLLDSGRVAPLPAAQGVQLYWAERPAS